MCLWSWETIHGQARNLFVSPVGVLTAVDIHAFLAKWMYLTLIFIKRSSWCYSSTIPREVRLENKFFYCLSLSFQKIFIYFLSFFIQKISFKSFLLIELRTFELIAFALERVGPARVGSASDKKTEQTFFKRLIKIDAADRREFHAIPSTSLFRP